MVKLAIDLDHALGQRRRDGTPGRTSPRVISRGEGWTVADVMCTAGPLDRPFEEEHACQTIAIVLAGSFHYRSPLGRGLMTPGSLLLGNTGQCFECGHRHGEGDRCLSVWYSPEYFERLAVAAGARGSRAGFTVPRVPPSRPLSPLVAQAGAGALGATDIAWEEFGVRLAIRTVRLAAGMTSGPARFPPNAEARVTRTVRTIDRHPDGPLSLGRLARQADLSPYHFLRLFERVTGVTPHQYVRRARLREAATRLMSEPRKVLDVALECGFGDVSNFNRAFKAEFGASPRGFRGTGRDLDQPATG